LHFGKYRDILNVLTSFILVQCLFRILYDTQKTRPAAYNVRYSMANVNVQGVHFNTAIKIRVQTEFKLRFYQIAKEVFRLFLLPNLLIY